MSMVATRAWSMLFMPSAVIVLGLVVGLMLFLRAWARGKRPAQCRITVAWTGCCAAALLVCTMPWFAVTMLRLTEHPFVPVDPATLPESDAIVVLGGSMAASRGPDGLTHLFNRGAGDRFETGLLAWQLGRAPLIAFGGGAPAIAGAPAEGTWNCARAIARGVPRTAAIAGAPAMFTTDESEAIVRDLKERGVRRIILCTSATHMTRALRVYRSHGLEVEPLPCDFATRGEAESFSAWMLVPRGEALWHVDLCAKEWLGRAAMAMSGR
jgi:uncharacterized SAM-binding protein YcdF (DUF218 family)